MGRGRCSRKREAGVRGWAEGGGWASRATGRNRPETRKKKRKGKVLFSFKIEFYLIF